MKKREIFENKLKFFREQFLPQFEELKKIILSESPNLKWKISYRDNKYDLSVNKDFNRFKKSVSIYPEIRKSLRISYSQCAMKNLV